MLVVIWLKFDGYLVLFLSVDVLVDSDGDLLVNYWLIIGDVLLLWYSNIVVSGFKMISCKFYLICFVYINVFILSYIIIIL